MDELLSRHRKEERDLQSRITQKKKATTKKNRKAVNDECSNLERDLKEKQDSELVALDGGEQDGDDASERADLATLVIDSSNDQNARIHVSEEAASVRTHGTSDTKQRKPNRQKARLARRAAENDAIFTRAAEEALKMPDLKERERVRMLKEFEKRGLKEKEIAANGHCMYSAMADQLLALDVDWQPIASSNSGHIPTLDYKLMRNAAASYISANPDDFAPFLEVSLDDYVHTVRNTGEWGGHLELLALAKVYKLNINIIQNEGRLEQIQGSEGISEKIAWLAYYKHGFGLGEHYNSLRGAGSQSPG